MDRRSPSSLRHLLSLCLCLISLTRFHVRSLASGVSLSDLLNARDDISKLIQSVNLSKTKLNSVSDPGPTAPPSLGDALNSCIDDLNLALEDVEMAIEATQSSSSAADLKSVPFWVSAAGALTRSCREEIEAAAISNGGADFRVASHEDSIQGGSSSLQNKLLDAHNSLLKILPPLVQGPSDSSTKGRKLLLHSDDPWLSNDDFLENKYHKELKDLQKALQMGLFVKGNGTVEVAKSRKGRKLLAFVNLKKYKDIITVAKDGTGDYSKIQDACDYSLNANPKPSAEAPLVIYVKAGTYKEQVECKKKHTVLVGDGATKTFVKQSDSTRSGKTTMKTATLTFSANFISMLGFRIINGAGRGTQAVSFISKGDQTAVYGCSFDGYQDTLYSHTGRHYFKACSVSGTIDMVFGYAATVFRRMLITVKPPDLMIFQNTISAHGRQSPNEPTGFYFSKCTIRSANVPRGALSYLGRPWFPYARQVFGETYIPSIISPDGWLTWVGNTYDGKPYLGEFNNYGPGARSKRVSWAYPGIVPVQDRSFFEPGNFIQSSDWLPSLESPITVD